MKYWSRSALAIYKYLPSMAKAIDKQVLDMGINSNSSQLQQYKSTYSQINQLCELVDRKRKMLNMKTMVELALNKLSGNNLRVLTLIYIDGVKSEMVAQLLGVSIRTFFRKKIEAIKEFVTAMQSLNFNETLFEEEYSQEKWFMAVYNDCISKSISSDYSLNNIMIKRVFKAISCLNCA